VSEYQKKGRRRNPDKQRDQNLKREYGVSLQEVRAILKEQRGRCAICNAVIADTGRNCQVDHDHVTSRIRGILCAGCNVGLGRFRDDTERLHKAIEYLNKKKRTVKIETNETRSL
jgi:hypothetical protein